MLAYSSIENMGLLALGAAIGSPLAIAAVLLHILGHGLAKSVAVPRRRPDPAADRQQPDRRASAAWPPGRRCWPAASGSGVLALIGFPPFSLFASEFGIARAGFAAGLGWVTAAALLLVLVIAGSLLVHTSRMLLGTAPTRRALQPIARPGRRTAAGDGRSGARPRRTRRGGRPTGVGRGRRRLGDGRGTADLCRAGYLASGPWARCSSRRPPW